MANPIVGLMIAILFTVLVQSSSTCTSVIVSLVSSDSKSPHSLNYSPSTCTSVIVSLVSSDSKSPHSLNYSPSTCTSVIVSLVSSDSNSPHSLNYSPSPCTSVIVSLVSDDRKSPHSLNTALSVYFIFELCSMQKCISTLTIKVGIQSCSRRRGY